MKILNLALLILFVSMAFVSCKDDDTTPKKNLNDSDLNKDAVIIDNDYFKDSDITLQADKLYLVDGLAFVKEKTTLTIPAGTIIKFKKTPTTGKGASSSLIIARGAKIKAEGTASKPIIFTAEADDPKTDGEELSKTSVGEWAGLIILGKAPVMKKGITDLNIEGIPSTEPLGQYGGSEASDNSGVLKYVSIRYTGITLNGESGNEIQGLTLGGVGSGTTIDYVDIYVTGDDGIEIFGGTANIRHISVSFATDDAFDFDQGYRGTAQFLFSIMDGRTDGSDNTGEWDGAGQATDDPFSAPVVSNWTAIGAGKDSDGGASQALTIREWFAGKVVNSVFEDYKGKAIRVEDLEDNEEDSYAYLTTPRDSYQLTIDNNTFANFGEYVDTEGVGSLAKSFDVKDSSNKVTYNGETAELVKILNDDNEYKESALTSISREKNGQLDPTPKSDLGTEITKVDGISPTTYRGAFAESGSLWIANWTALAKFGYLAN